MDGAPRTVLLVGIVLVIAGLFPSSSGNTSIFPVFIEEIIFSWQMLLILIGLIITVGGSNRTPGIILMAVGGFFLIPELFYEIFGRYRIFWPALFIAAGILVIFAGRGSPVKNLFFHHESGFSGTDYIDVVNISQRRRPESSKRTTSGVARLTNIFGRQ
ncbi:MAG: DUF5668 domain-containing protein [Marinilabiliales bacterium]|nr:DUF5668 domain-containing protein [Marinilabiliales bacterium]